MANKVYNIVVKKITDALDQGIVPWKQSWSNQGSHVNITTKKPYRGMNIMLLNVEAAIHSYKYPLWLTFNQAKKKHWSIRAGAKTALVTFYTSYNAKNGKDKDGDEITELNEVFILRYYTVFNIQDIVGYEDKEEFKELSGPARDTDKDSRSIEQRAEILKDYLTASGINLTDNEQRAAYSVNNDSINMPQYDSFISQEAFYAVLSHEIIHSTGAKSRLNRFKNGWCENSERSKEELIAEIGSAFLCSIMGIKVDYGNTAAYLSGWSEYLQHSPKLEIFSASKQARMAADYVKSESLAGRIKRKLKKAG